ncbi:MAG TPA: chemotaxis protein CheB [Solirubrobacteraceae bacterium]|nr:chemotaxis protein CheB [Solirubrobacteraceae bacterium]
MQGDRLPEDPDGRCDLVVIGASAGGVEVLTPVVNDLPTDLRATVCIVLQALTEAAGTTLQWVSDTAEVDHFADEAGAA